MRILLIGASGVLGDRLYKDILAKKWGVAGTYYSSKYDGLIYLDLRDRLSVEKALDAFGPDVVILAAGITNVDLCESDPKLAQDVNIKGHVNLIKKIGSLRSPKLVFLSTDYVFDGKKGPYSESDTPSPVNTYGRTKLEIEELIKKEVNDYLIIRTAQLYGMDHSGENFAVKIVSSLKNKNKVYAAEDFYCTPTYAPNLSSCILELIEKNKAGLYHVAGLDFINRVEFVNNIADVFDLDKSLIQRTSLKGLGLLAKRPRRAGLKVGKVKEELGDILYSCKKGLSLLKKELDHD